MTGVALDDAVAAPPARRARPRLLARLTGASFKLLVATLLCLGPVTSVVAAGWLLRLQGRQAVRRWFERSSLAATVTFEGFALEPAPHAGRDGVEQHADANV